MANLNGSGSFIGNSSTSTASLLTVTGSGTYSGTIENHIGSGTQTTALTYNGSGNTLTLSGTNTYTGTTTVSAGTLSVTGSTTSATTVNGGTLSGTGTISSSVTVNSGGTISPGILRASSLTPGTLNASSAILAGGGNFQFGINNPAGGPVTQAGINWNLLNASGNLNITATSGSPFVVSLQSLTGTNSFGTLSGFNPATSYTWDFAKFATLSNFGTGNEFNVSTSGFSNSFTGSFSVIDDSANSALAVHYSRPPCRSLAVCCWQASRLPG